VIAVTVRASMDAWGAVAIGSHPFVAILAFSLVVHAVRVDENPIGSELLEWRNLVQMMARLTSRASAWTRGLTAGVFEVLIVYKGICKELPKADHAAVGCSVEAVTARRKAKTRHSQRLLIVAQVTSRLIGWWRFALWSSTKCR